MLASNCPTFIRTVIYYIIVRHWYLIFSRCRLSIWLFLFVSWVWNYYSPLLQNLVIDEPLDILYKKSFYGLGITGKFERTVTELPQQALQILKEWCFNKFLLPTTGLQIHSVLSNRSPWVRNVSMVFWWFYNWQRNWNIWRKTKKQYICITGNINHCIPSRNVLNRTIPAGKDQKRPKNPRRQSKL